MHQPIKWWTGLLPLAAIWIIATTLNTVPIETDLTTRAKTATAGMIDNFTAAASGRDILLSGSAAGPDAIARAVAAAEATFGVRKVIAGLREARPSAAAPANVPAPASMAAPITSAASCQSELADAVSKERIRFKTGSADLDEASAPVLAAVLAIAKRCQTGSIEVTGHTDTQGDPQNNMALSTARAQSVVRHLAANGIAAARLSAVGLGDTRPVASNDAEAGRAQNRRIEFSVR